MGEFLRDTEGLVAAEQWLAKALEKAPGNIDIRLELAACQLDIGQGVTAIKTLDEGGEAIKDAPRAAMIRAVHAARMGDDVAARDWLAQSGAVTAKIPAAVLLSAVLDLRGGTYESAAQSLASLVRRQPDNMRAQELLAFALSQSGDHEELVYRFEATALSHRGSPYLRTMVGRAHEALDQRESAAIFLDRAAVPEAELGILPPATSPENLRLG